MALRLLQSSRGMKTLASGAYKKTPESAQKVMDTFAKYKACAVLRTPKAEQCAPAMQAAIDGGFDIVEFTLTTPGCLDQVANFRAKYDGKVMVGCGTVMDIDDAKKAMDTTAPALAESNSIPPSAFDRLHSSFTFSRTSISCRIGHLRLMVTPWDSEI